MINFGIGFSSKFDKNTYEFEKQKQKMENIVKAKEKERQSIQKEKERQNKENEKENEKDKANASKKIQINFHNSFVNKQTQKKYDKIIENNNIRNIEKQEQLGMPQEEKEIKSSNQLSINITEGPNSVPTKNNNMSEMILIQSISFLNKTAQENTSKINDTTTEVKVDQDEKNSNRAEKYEIIPIEDTIMYASEEDNCNANNDTQSHNLKINSKSIEHGQNSGNKYTEDTGVIEDQLAHESVNIEIPEEEIKEDFKSEEEGLELTNSYDKFLLETMNKAKKITVSPQDDFQDILKNQMKSIISNIKDRQKESDIVKGEKKKIIAGSLMKAIPNTNQETGRDSETFPCEKYPSRIKDVTSDNFNKLTTPREEKCPPINYIPQNNDEDIVTEDAEGKKEEQHEEEKQIIITNNIQVGHQSELMKEDQNDEIVNEEKIYNINIEEFIRENTKDDIANEGHEYLENNNNVNEYYQQDNPENGDDTNIEKESEVVKNTPNRDNRLIVFENFSNENEYQQKIQKLEKIKEKKLREIEKKREKSKNKIKVQTPSIQDKPIVIINDTKSKAKQIFEKKQVNVRPASGKSPTPATQKDNTNNVAKIISNDSSRPRSGKNESENSNPIRIPIKIQREEAQAANKKVKANLNYTKLSNKKVIKSAICTVCLAGEPNRTCREKIIEIIEKCPCENFVILFKGNFGRYDLKAVYTLHPQTNRVELLTCLINSPIVLEGQMIASYFKYDLIQKDFKQLTDNKEFSVIVDGVTLISRK